MARIAKKDHIIIFGDSLSDRGTLATNPILNVASGLASESTTDRFTTQYVWSDYFAEIIAKNVHQQDQDDDINPLEEVDLSDQDDDINSLEEVDLSNPDEVIVPWTTNFIRTYCVGGMTSHDYSDIESANMISEIKEAILTNLTEQRKLFFKDDSAICITEKQKKSTVIIEWTGANDLITVQKIPTSKSVENAIAARIEHINELAKAGYHDFILFNLPDLSLTPRFQNGNEQDRKIVKRINKKFNKKLKDKVSELLSSYKELNIHIYDINKEFNNMVKDPEKYGLDKDKMKSPWLESSDCQTNKTQGYAYWDDVHPTSQVHKQIAENFYQTCFSQSYQYVPPEYDLLQEFRTEYGERLRAAQRGCCGCWARASIDYTTATLPMIFSHASEDTNSRTNEVMKALKWFNGSNQLILRHPSWVISNELKKQKALKLKKV